MCVSAAETILLKGSGSSATEGSVPMEMCPAGSECGCGPLPLPKVSGSVVALAMICFQRFL